MPGSGVTSARLVLPSMMPPKPRPTASDRCCVTCQVGSIVPENRSPLSPPAVEARAYCSDASSDQSGSSRTPSRSRNPSNRPLGAPSRPTMLPYSAPRPIRKPLRRHASRSASVGSDSFGSPSPSVPLDGHHGRRRRRFGRVSQSPSRQGRQSPPRLSIARPPSGRIAREVPVRRGAGHVLGAAAQHVVAEALAVIRGPARYDQLSQVGWRRAAQRRKAAHRRSLGLKSRVGRSGAADTGWSRRASIPHTTLRRRQRGPPPRSRRARDRAVARPRRSPGLPTAAFRRPTPRVPRQTRSHRPRGPRTHRAVRGSPGAGKRRSPHRTSPEGMRPAGRASSSSRSSRRTRCRPSPACPAGLVPVR